MKHFLRWLAVAGAILLILYLAGPRPDELNFNLPTPDIPDTREELEQYVLQREDSLPVRANNQSRIVWYDSARQKTPYSFLYLHGFSASPEEGRPLHTDIAARYGGNLYLPRLHGHGLDEQDPMINFRAEKLVQSAREALHIAKALGDSIIVISTSTGGTLDLIIGADPRIAGHIMYSPNIDLFDPLSALLTQPWGLQLARVVVGGKYNAWPLDSPRVQFWTNKYRLEALIELKALVEQSMTEETFSQITQPVFTGYYYKSDSAQDSTVSVPAILDMYNHLGTPTHLKRKVAFAKVGHHVLACDMTSNDLASVKKETYRFLEEVMHLQPVAAGVKETTDTLN